MSRSGGLARSRRSASSASNSSRMMSGPRSGRTAWNAISRRHQLDDGRPEARRDELRGVDDHPSVGRRQPPTLARPVDVPCAGHLHVRVQHDVLVAARERDEEMLPVRLDRADDAADDLEARGVRAHPRRDDLESRDHLARERAPQHVRDAVDRVAFRHSVSCSHAGCARNRPNGVAPPAGTRRPEGRRSRRGRTGRGGRGSPRPLARSR